MPHSENNPVAERGAGGGGVGPVNSLYNPYTVWHGIFAADYVCGLAIFYVLRELIVFASGTDWLLRF